MSKNSKIISAVVFVLIIIGLIVWFGNKSSGPATPVAPLGEATGSSTQSVAVSETTKVSGSTSQYENAELGFSVQYPSSWEKDETTTGVQFIMPIDQTQVSTVAKLESDIAVVPGKCAFPPVTTVQDKGTINVGNMKFNTISMSNNVQGRSYFDRMYSYQDSNICYAFHFSYIALSPEAKGLTGSNLTQAQNNNKAIQSTSDAAFTSMVKSFALVTLPAGESETQANPTK
ncbi:MAG: hypothetical protein KGI49_01750 [Patescibacteria group bacterium]|nr:hypothetical protein [Patescibacteria group bacterium]